VSSPPVPPKRACADGFGRLRSIRARRQPAGFLVLAASFLWLALPPPAVAQFPIRQLPGGGPTFKWGLQPKTPTGRVPLNALPVQLSPYGADPPAQQPTTPPHPAVARVTVPEKDGISYGSGTLIDARGQFGLVVTNWHVVRDAAGTITVEFPGGFKSPAQVVKTDKDWDLAALSIHRPGVHPLPISSAVPQPGDVLTIAGYGSGEWRTATGRCTQYLAPGVDFPHEMVELSTEARQGDSGGPIINQRGEIAGVLFGSGPGYTSGSYGGRVLQFLATVVPGGTPGSDQPPPANGQLAQATPPRGNVPGPSAEPPPQSTALHAENPPQPPLGQWAGGGGPSVAADPVPLTPAARPLESPLLSPPPRSDIATRFGPLARTAEEQADSRVAVVPDRLAVAAASIPPGGVPASHIPALIDAPLASRVGGTAPAVDLNQAPPVQLLAAFWKQVGGTTFADQAKTVLAGVGVLALLVMFWRMGREREPEHEEE
jgi:serine protease Do